VRASYEHLVWGYTTGPPPSPIPRTLPGLWNQRNQPFLFITILSFIILEAPRATLARSVKFFGIVGGTTTFLYPARVKYPLLSSLLASTHSLSPPPLLSHNTTQPDDVPSHPRLLCVQPLNSSTLFPLTTTLIKSLLARCNMRLCQQGKAAQLACRRPIARKRLVYTTLEPMKVKTWFQYLLSHGSTCTATARRGRLVPSLPRWGCTS
jgi:hypothetical protein